MGICVRGGAGLRAISCLIFVMGCGSPKGTDLFEPPSLGGGGVGVGGSKGGSGGSSLGGSGGAPGGVVGTVGGSGGSGGTQGPSDAGEPPDSDGTRDGGTSDDGAGGSGGRDPGGTDGGGPADHLCPLGAPPAGWICVVPGMFLMGSPASEPGRRSDETQHRVTITRAFFIMTNEVTQGSWATMMGKNPASYTKCGEACPVEKVSWFDAVAYADALSAKDGYAPCYRDPEGGAYNAASAAAGRTPLWDAGPLCNGYRLPTEAEWEYAARAGTTTPFDTGPVTSQSCSPADANLDMGGWYSCNSNDTTHRGGTKRANPWGLFDMHGNVFEWVWDFYGPYAGDATDPLGASSGSGRVNRGGGWWSPAIDCRAAARLSNAPSKTYDDTGFRLVRSVP